MIHIDDDGASPHNSSPRKIPVRQSARDHPSRHQKPSALEEALSSDLGSDDPIRDNSTRNPELRSSRPSLGESDIPGLRARWIAACADLLGPIPVQLPPWRDINHEIPLIDESLIYNYHMPRCPDALKPELRDKINRYVDAGWWTLKPVAQAAPLLCIPKKSGKLRTVVDARKRNDNTVKDVTPFPDQDQIRMDVARAKYRTKIDMSDAYEQVRIITKDIWKTAFATVLGTAVSQVMQQGDCNAPATFQRLMTWIFRKYIGTWLHVYLDDIFVFSDTIEDHENHLKITFDILRKEMLFLSKDKLDLYSNDMDCLGHRIDDKGLHADVSKMDRIIDWRTPRSYNEVLRFLGLVEYIGQFMPDVSMFTSPLQSMARNGAPFIWRAIHTHCLEGIKQLASRTPILRPVDIRIKERIWLICDASIGGVGAMYGQGPDWRSCRPAGFMSKKFTSAQRSYKTYEQEALAIIEGLLKWEDKLLGRKITIATDHKALKAVKTAVRDGFNGRQIRWDEYLSRFDFDIEHVSGATNKVADCLSRYYDNDGANETHGEEVYVNADVRLDPDMEDLPNNRRQEILDSRNRNVAIMARRVREPVEARVTEAEELQKYASALEELGLDATAMTLEESLKERPPLRPIIEGDTDFLEFVRQGYTDDSVLSKVLESPNSYASFSVEDGLIFTTNRSGERCICIPRAFNKQRTRRLSEIILDGAHLTVGHLGPLRTSEYIRHWYWWPRMGKDIEKFCMSCGHCQTTKTGNKKPEGLLHSMPIASYPWESVGMDFVGPFPKCLGYDYMLVVICRMTSMIHLTPMMVTNSSSDVAWFFLRDIVRLHGMPKSIVSDRDSKFTAKFWRELHRLTGTKLLMSTSFHPQTDGASERAIRNVSQILRALVLPSQTDWVYKTPITEFAINSSRSSSTGFAPFEINYGQMPVLSNVLSHTAKYKGVRDFAERSISYIAIAHDAIIESRVNATHFANKSRIPGTPYTEGTLVYLSTKNLNLPKARAKKLAPKYIGPFAIVKAYPDTSNYKLSLSEELASRGIHPTFHASLLRPHEPNDETVFPGREAKVYYDFGMPDDEQWFVEEINGHRWVGRRIEFRVKWTAGDYTWEPYVNVGEAAALDDYLSLMGISDWKLLAREGANLSHD